MAHMKSAAWADSFHRCVAESMALDVPCFDHLLGEPKDTQVIITVDGPAAAEEEHVGFKRGRPRASGTRATMEAHRVVLDSLSPVLSSQLERWTPEEPVSKVQRQQQGQPLEPHVKQEQQQDVEPHQDHHYHYHHHQQQQQGGQPQGPCPYQYKLQLQVPPGQLELGRRLITAMYGGASCGGPQLSDLENHQLVQLAVIAQRYSVSKVLVAAALPLTFYRLETMPQDTAAAIFGLPEACRALEVYQPVYRMAAEKLQQDLGDLEAAWNGSYLRAKALVDLPLGALLQLLGDERTRVASEDTAMLTAETWLRHNPDKLEQAPQLLSVLRLPRCTASYLISSSTAVFLRKLGLTEDEERDLHTMLALPELEAAQLRALYTHRPAWQLPPRLASADMQLTFHWDLRLANLKASLDAAQDGPTCIPSVHRHIWHGRVWECGAFVTARGGFGLYLTCLQGRAFCHANFEIKRLPGSYNAELPRMVWAAAGECIQGVHYSHMYGDNYSVEGFTWEDLSSWLMADRLVQPGGLLQCSITLTKVA